MFKAATLYYIGSQLIGKSEREELAKVFKSLDKTNRGSLSKDEIRLAFDQHYGRPLTEKEVNAIFSAVDTSKTGAINYSEFLVACADKDSLLSNERLTAALKMFDKDGDGMITRNEIKNLFSQSGNKLPETVVSSIIKSIDENGDGEISSEEFINFMRQSSKVS